MNTDFVELKNLINREGSYSFFEWLYRTDFFTAPASTNAHGAWPEGLLSHSIGTAQILIELTRKNNIQWDYPDSPIIVGLLHDICKVNSYREYSKNYKDASGRWRSRTEYCFDEQLPLGHGEKSLFLVSQFMQLTNQEALCIRWHMTSYESWAERVASEKALLLCQNILWVRTADRLEAQNNNQTKSA